MPTTMRKIWTSCKARVCSVTENWSQSGTALIIIAQYSDRTCALFCIVFLIFCVCGFQSADSSVQDTLTDLSVLRVFLKEEMKGSAISFESRKWSPLLKIIYAEKLSNNNDMDEDDYDKFTLSEDIVASLDAVEHLSLSIKVTGSKELVILLHCALMAYGTTFPYVDSR